MNSAVVSDGLVGEDYRFCFGFCPSDACGPTCPVIPAQRGRLFIQKEKKQKSHVTQSRDRRRKSGAKAQTEATEGARGAPTGSKAVGSSVNIERQETGRAAL